MNKNLKKGHLSAIFTIFIWGTTFISTKLLLVEFQPVEILFFRFLLGYGALWLFCPHPMTALKKGEERYFIAAGFCGICLYYLLENIALTYTSASNVGVIFTAMLSGMFMKQKNFHRNFILGFLCAMIGILWISAQGSALNLNPFGDFLALFAAFVWACYSILTNKISEFSYSTIQSTRRIFFYGLLFMLPTLVLFDFHPNLVAFTQPAMLGNLLFLGIGASALCFVTWNSALKYLGPVQTSAYIYMVPVITTITSMVVLQEQITALTGVGICLTLCGLWLSQIEPKERRMRKWKKNVSSY